MPTPVPTSLNASMVTGTDDCATKAALFTCVGKMKPLHPPGSVIVEGHGGGDASGGGSGWIGSCSTVSAPRRASAKYRFVVEPVLVTIIGTRSGFPVTESFTPALSGKPIALIFAVSKPI